MSKLSFKNSFALLVAAVLMVSGFLVFAGTVSAIAEPTSTVNLGVTQIAAVKTFATADGTYTNGWSWVFDITVPTNETTLNMKFADWTNGSSTIPAAGHIKFFSAQSLNANSDSNAVAIGAAGTYSGNMYLNPESDLNTLTQAGRQIQITVEVAVPVGSAGGSYSTSYGLQTNPTLPVIAAPLDQAFEATGESTTPTLVAATVTDGIDANPVVTYAPQSFPVGTTSVVWTATDILGNKSSTTSKVTITDTTKPVITGTPEDITAEASLASGAVVSYTTPTATDTVDGSDTVTCLPASDSTFVLGATTISCNATDAAGNTAVPTTFTVTVKDTTAPSVTAPEDVSVEATGVGTTVALGSPTVSDLVDANPVVTNNAPEAGFPVGKTTVTWTATDASENSATATQTVTVVPATPVVTWGTPADITYGTELGDTQLNATASVDGTFTYTPAAGTILNADTAQVLSVTFAPTDTTDYNTVIQTVSINVNPETVNVSTTDGTMVYGENPPAFAVTYSPDVTPETPATCSTNADSTSPVGSSYVSSCSGASDPNYTFIYTDGSVSVIPATATLILNDADLTQTYSGTAKTVGVTTSPEGLDAVTVSYIDSDGNPVDSPVNFGTYGVTATLLNPNYTAEPVTRTLIIKPAAPTVTGLEIVTPATKLIYTVGDKLDIAGLSVAKKYSDGSTTSVTIAIDNVTGFNSSDAAIGQVLTISIDGQTTTYTVDINAGSSTPSGAVPVIHLNGDAEMTIPVGDRSTFDDPGAFADDGSQVYTAGDAVDVTKIGTYVEIYNASNTSGDAIPVSRTVHVVAAPPAPDTTAPVITLNGVSELTITVGDTYVDAGATALDNVDGNITASIVTVIPVDANVIGDYTITYNVADAATNPATEVTRTVHVVAAP